ncbi:MAG: hypothetical protein PHQ43_12350, partial [Dehalococcoidales bacterium]|nr:hypothetical protein [Dehalococcoidales bacterium]
TAIRQYNGRSILDVLDNFMNDIARDGIDRANINRTADWIRANYTTAVLGIKPAIALKQIPSVVAYMTDMPVTDFAKGIADFWTNPIAHYRFLMENSTFAKTRFTRGFERDIRFAMRQKTAKQIAGMGNFRDWFFTLISTGDKVAVVQGMWAKYQSGLSQGLSQADAIRQAEITTQRTQPTSDLETLAMIQRGHSFLKLATMFQNQPNKYFRLLADNARNFQYGRGSRTKAAGNLFLVWVVLPCLFQLIADAFKWNTEHQARAWVLGPVNHLLVFGQIAQSMYGWLGNEKFDYSISPVFESIEDLQMVISKAAKMVRDGKDPYEDIDVNDFIKAVEYFAKAAGQVVGLPTPYLIQIEKAIRDGRPMEFIFSRWALGNPEGDVNKEVSDLFAGLGAVPEGAERGELSIKPENVYTLNTLDNDIRRKMRGMLPDDILSGDYSPIIKAWAEKEKARAEADILPDMALSKINTDPEEDDTILQYYQQWQARLEIDNLRDLEEFDKLYPKAYLGNVTRRQYELMVQYMNTPEDKRADFLEAHPELQVNPRDKWLQSHPEQNAMLAVWGDAKLWTVEARQHVQDFIEEYDIPDSALGTLPPVNIMDALVRYNTAVSKFGATSAEAKLLRLENPALNDWGDWGEITDPVQALRISVQYRAEDEAYNAIKAVDNSYQAQVDRDKAREDYLKIHPEYARARREREAWRKGYPDHLIEEYVEYYMLPTKGNAKWKYRRTHKEFNDVAERIEGWKPLSGGGKGLTYVGMI